MSIRLRLTLLYSAILVTTLLAFSGSLYLVQSRYTLRLLRTDLIRTVERATFALERALTLGGAGPMRRPGGLRLLMEQLALWDLRTRDRVQILDGEGNLVEHPANDPDDPLPLSERALSAYREGRPWTETAQLEDERWLIYGQPVSAQGRVIAIIQAARSLADRDRSLRALGGTLAIGSALTTLVAFGIGWILSELALRPIQRITQTAHAIGEARDFSQRVAYRGPNDEVGQLAVTFNAMLARLQDAYQQVERSLEKQREFVADVSHELRTPLTTIRGNLALLQRDPPLPPAERQDALHDMVDESERLSRLVGELLSLARADAGLVLEARPLRVDALVQDICRQARSLAPGRQVECSSPGDVVCLADHDALKQVMLALVDNALVHTSGRVSLAVEERDGMVALHVADEGPGMPPEVRARVFDRFYRGDAARSTSGSGLGLAIARSLVEAQGGTIEVQSDAARGSTFSVRLRSPGPAH